LSDAQEESAMTLATAAANRHIRRFIGLPG
jgi:hypothetical protein